MNTHFSELELIKADLKEFIPDYLRIVDWRELNPSLFNAIEVERNVMFLILLLIIIVAAFNLISSMMILVSNKKIDIGVLRVLGISKFQLLRIFILNGFLIGFLGTILGVVIGLSFCVNINAIKMIHIQDFEIDAAFNLNLIKSKFLKILFLFNRKNIRIWHYRPKN